MTANEWRPLGVREGTQNWNGPFEGVPAAWHLAIGEWVGTVCGIHRPGAQGTDKGLVVKVLAATNTPVPDAKPFENGYDLYGRLRLACEHDEERYLNVIDALLQFAPDNFAGRLERILMSLGSVWRVGDDQRSLIRRVSVPAQAAFARVVSQGGAAAQHLSAAWTACFGRNPSAKTAWSEAIQALEAVYIPLVVPNMAKANLGAVVGQLKGDKTWTSVLQPNGALSGPRLIEEMLRALWVEPNRHPQTDSTPTRVPTLEEAQALVPLAVTLAEWARQGVLRQPSGPAT